LARCDTIDDLFKIIDITVKEVTEVGVSTGEPQFVVVIVDTIAGTSSREEMTQDWAKEDFNRQAKFLSKGMRKMSRDIARHNVAMICVNQVRDSFKAKSMAGKFAIGPQDEDFSTFGGRALKFYSSLRVFMHAVSKTYTLCRGTSRFSQGLLIQFTTTKNRLRKPSRQGRLALLFSCGLSRDYSKLETLINYHLVEQKKDGSNTLQIKAKQHGIDLEQFSLKPRQQNPELGSRLEWPAFCQRYPAVVETLWKKVIDIAFSDALIDPTRADEDGDSDDEDVVDPLTD